MENQRKGPPHGWFGYIYLLKCGELYKIGFSLKPRKRLKQFRTGSPHPIELVHTLRTPHFKMLEQILHRRFAQKRQTGEWFKLDPEDVEHIKSVNGIGRTPQEQDESDQREAEFQARSKIQRDIERRAEARAVIAIVAAV
jgi:hypothetical protein